MCNDTSKGEGVHLATLVMLSCLYLLSRYYFFMRCSKISLNTPAESFGYRLHPSSLSTIVIPNRGP